MACAGAPLPSRSSAAVTLDPGVAGQPRSRIRALLTHGKTPEGVLANHRLLEPPTVHGVHPLTPHQPRLDQGLGTPDAGNAVPHRVFAPHRGAVEGSPRGLPLLPTLAAAGWGALRLAA